jgi:hypothetical protein
MDVLSALLGSPKATVRRADSAIGVVGALGAYALSITVCYSWVWPGE